MIGIIMSHCIKVIPLEHVVISSKSTILYMVITHSIRMNVMFSLSELILEDLKWICTVLILVPILVMQSSSLDILKKQLQNYLTDKNQLYRMLWPELNQTVSLSSFCNLTPSDMLRKAHFVSIVCLCFSVRIKTCHQQDKVIGSEHKMSIASSRWINPCGFQFLATGTTHQPQCWRHSATRRDLNKSLSNIPAIVFIIPTEEANQGVHAWAPQLNEHWDDWPCTHDNLESEHHRYGLS